MNYLALYQIVVILFYCKLLSSAVRTYSWYLCTDRDLVATNEILEQDATVQRSLAQESRSRADVLEGALASTRADAVRHKKEVRQTAILFSLSVTCINIIWLNDRWLWFINLFFILLMCLAWKENSRRAQLIRDRTDDVTVTTAAERSETWGRRQPNIIQDGRRCSAIPIQTGSSRMEFSSNQVILVIDILRPK